MMRNFQAYLKLKLNEAQDPQIGDSVYLGIHDLHRNDFTLDQEKAQDKMGEIVHIDPINEKARIKIKTDPFHLGYRKLEDPQSRQRRKKMSKDDQTEISIPLAHLKDISRLSPEQAKTWLLVDRNTRHQTEINKKLNKFMNKDPEPVSQQVSQQTPPEAEEMDTDFELPDSNKIQFSGNKPIQYFQMNREVVPVPFESDYWNRAGWKMESKVNPKTYEYY